MDQLSRWLQSRGDKVGCTVPMPLQAGKKRPALRHSGKSTYGWPECEAYVRENPGHTEWGLLLDGLCVVDCDSAAAVAAVEALGARDADVGAALARCAVQETSKGRHYVFYRPRFCDEEGYYDGARQTGVAIADADFKTRCATGTRGVLAVAPSKGKRWAPGRAPWEVGDLPYAPRALVEAVAAPRGGGCGGGVVIAKVTTPPIAPLVPASFVASRPVEKLLLLLGKGRWESYGSWRDIATSLKNSYGEEYRAAWDRLSRMSPSYEAEAASRLWESVGRPDYSGPKLSVKTLEGWARQDDPHGYALYRASALPAEVKEKWSQGDRGLGEIAASLLRDTAKCVKDGGDCFLFEEVTCRWKRVTEKALRGPASHALDDTLADVGLWLTAELSSVGAAGADAEAMSMRRKSLEEKLSECKGCRKYVRSTRGIRNVLEYAAPLLVDETFEQRLDSHPHLIGLKGGYAVDLRTGSKRRTTAEDMIHVELDVTFSSPPYEWIHAMVRTMMGGDEEMARFLQLQLGYGITGDVSEEVFPIWTGSGRNGKGVIMQSVLQLLGIFYREMNCAVISDSRTCSNIDAERAKLLGARLAVFNELKPGEKLKTNEVQLLTGGDGIPAKALYRDPITIQPRHLCVLTTNHMPELTEVITAMVERLLCIEFPVTFRDLMPGEEETPTLRQVDKTLKDRLKSPEGQEALFAWLVEGAGKWYAVRGSLKRAAPAKVKAFTTEYLVQQDRVRAFLVEQCEFGEGMKESSTDLFREYKEKTGQHDDKWFHAQMKAKGFVKKVMRVDGVPMQGYDGLRLKSANADLGFD